MMLFLVLATLVAPPPSLSVIMAVNMTSFQEARKSHEHDSIITLMRGIESSNLTCSEAQLISMSGRTAGMMLLKDEASFDYPGYVLCLFGINDNYGSLHRR